MLEFQVLTFRMTTVGICWNGYTNTVGGEHEEIGMKSDFDIYKGKLFIKDDVVNLLLQTMTMRIER